MSNYKLKYSGEKIDEILTKADGMSEVVTATGETAGKVKLSDATDSESDVSAGVAATPKAVKAAFDAASAAGEAAGDLSTKVEENTTAISENATAVGKLEKDIDNLSNSKISKFYASSQGNTTLPDSDNGKIIDLKLYGKGSQQQYSGKNLYTQPKRENTLNGVKIIRDGNTMILSGTSNGSGPESTSAAAAIHLKKGQYAFSFKSHSGTLKGTSNDLIRIATTENDNVLNLSINTSSGSGNFELADEDDVRVICRVDSNSVYSNYKILVQIELGSTATAYEPYVGGIPSPNPEYPQEIKSVVKPVVKVCGKNLISKHLTADGTYNGLTYKTEDFGNIKVTGTNTSANANNDFKVFALTGVTGKYTASAKSTDSNISWRTIHNGTWGTGGTFDMQPTDTLLIWLNIKAGATVNGTIKIIVEKGETATAYEPYTEQTVTLPYTLNAIPVTSGGNVTIDGQQYIADYVDVERGKLVRMCKEIDFEKVTPSREINVLTNSREVRFSALEIGIKQLPSETPNNEAGFITSIRRLTPGTSTWNIDEVGVWQCGQGSNSSNLTIRVPPEAVIGYIEYIKSIGGCKGVFQAATPTETDLTADEIAAFKALVSYYPVTNVSTTSDQLNGYTVFNYPISLANGWNYVKQQIGDTRDYLYDIDLMTAEAYVNSEYAAALAEIEV
nr:MAG TPA: hypothetical protein [Caudoviricetes sp.]